MIHATEHYEIIIDDSALTKHGFTKFSLPLNGNGTKMVIHNIDKRKMIYPTFYKSDLGKTVQSLRDKIVSDGILIDDDTADGLVAYFRNAGVLLSEDEDSPFFKNGNGKWNGNGKSKSKKDNKSDDKSSSLADIVEALLESDSEEQVIIDPSKDLDPYITDRDYIEFVIKTAKKTVKQEDSLVRQIVYTGLTKDSANPQNLAILAPTSEGKTHAALETLEYFPHADLWKLGSMSPKVIIRQNGILVNNKYGPIEAQLKELKKQIRDCRKEGADEQADELEEKKHQLLQEAKVMIDLRGKLLVFLEPPHPETWNILKPILSHDSHYIEHPYVYHAEDFGFTVKKIVTRGWPACIFCSARNESKWPQWPEIQSRFLITSPLASMDISRPVFRNYHNETLVTMKYLGRTWAKSCKNISNHGIMDKDVIMDDAHNNVQNCGEDIEEWWQNEQKKIKPLDPSFFSDPAYQCYYCDDYYSDVFDKDCKTRYEGHVLVIHGNSPPYPNKGQIEKMGLKPQGKPWEK